MTELEYEVLRGIITELELASGVRDDQLRLRALREKLQAAELTRRMKAASKPPRKGLPWASILKWGLAGAVIIGALLAQLLGVNITEVLP